MLRWVENRVAGAYRSEQAVVEGGIYEKKIIFKNVIVSLKDKTPWDSCTNEWG